jgi:ankyrin repeat protein
MKQTCFVFAFAAIAVATAHAGAVQTAYQEHHDTLATAVADRHIPEITRLLDEGADPYALTRFEYKGQEAQGPVFAAAILSKDHAVLQAFLDAGVNVNKPLPFVIDGTSCAVPPVIVAVNHRIKTLKALLDKGATLDVAATACHETPLIEAVYAGNTLMVEYLLDQGRRINERGWNEVSVLHAAIASRAPFPQWIPQMLTVLLEAGAEVDAANRQGETPLHWAADHGRRDCLEMLLERGADVTRQDARGRTARNIAYENRQEAIMVILRREETRLRKEREQAVRDAAAAAARARVSEGENPSTPAEDAESETGAAAEAPETGAREPGE